MEGRALIELVIYIERVQQRKKVSDFCTKVAWKILAYPNKSSRFISRNNFFHIFLKPQTQSDGKNILLVFEKRRQQLLKQAHDTMRHYIYKDDSPILSKAAKTVRKDDLIQMVFKLVVILLVIVSKSLCQQISNISSPCYKMDQALKTKVPLNHRAVYQFLRLCMFNSTARPSKISSHHHLRILGSRFIYTFSIPIAGFMA